MSTATQSAVAGVFSTREAADRAVYDLRDAGFRDDEIGLVGRNDQGKIEHIGAGATLAEEGAAAGALAGAGVGAALGFGVLAGVIPAIGPAIVAGTLGTILTNVAAGAAVAGVVGALIGFGIPEDDARYYESEVKAGRYLVTVDAGERSFLAWDILNRRGGYNRSGFAPAM